MKTNTIFAFQQRLWDDWIDCEQSGIKPEDVLTGAREIMGLQINDDQIEETCAHHRYAPDWTSRDEEVSDQIREATDSEDPDKLYAWLEWIEGTHIADRIFEYFEETDEDPDESGYYNFGFLSSLGGVTEMTTTREYLLDSLADSSDTRTRAYAAYRGRKLDKLVNDPAPEVRAAVVRGGHGLSKLIEDPDPEVRAAVASSTNSLSQLDKLASDPAPEVRAVVALRKGYCVQMINDEDPTVRAVAWWSMDQGGN